MGSFAEYIWVDGTTPTPQLRSKTRIIMETPPEQINLSTFPDWGFDGSSTSQAEGNFSDLQLRPVRVVNDPQRGEGNYLVLCEVFHPNGQPHSSNTRSILRKIMEEGGRDQEVWVGFEQEYTFFSGGSPLGWPDNGFPKPQGPYYCGVGAERIYGRDIAEEHLQACIEAGLLIYGVNAEVMPGQWEFQIGHRDFDNQTHDALTFCDHLVFARWLLCRVAEDYNTIISFSNKPVKGDWNGAGCHTNFSTKDMRCPLKGKSTIDQAISHLSQKHPEHIAVYGDGLEERLTGDHETCSIHEFRAGVSDRGASVRIPMNVKAAGCGYIEDRRPGANCDPYLVASRLITTICGIDEGYFQPSQEQTQKIYEIKLKMESQP